MNSIKQFWLKLNLRTKVIFFIFVIVLFFSFIGWANYKKPEPVTTNDNSNYINRITNRNPILSYPVSYSKEWTGKITLIPANANKFQYATSNTQQCSGITPNMDIYYTDSLDSLMVITNKNLLNSTIELTNYNTAVDTIKDNVAFDKNNAELQIFRTYCSYFSLFLMDNLQKQIPDTDYSQVIVGLGLRQNVFDDVNGVGIYIYAYAVKDDYLVQISRSLQGSFIFSQSNWDSCKSKTLQIDQNQCLMDIYSKDPSMKSKIDNEANKLISDFALENGE